MKAIRRFFTRLGRLFKKEKSIVLLDGTILYESWAFGVNKIFPVEHNNIFKHFHCLITTVEKWNSISFRHEYASVVENERARLVEWINEIKGIKGIKGIKE